MIKIPKSFQVNVGDATGFNYTITSSTNCVSVDKPSGTFTSSSGTINVILTFEDLNTCFNTDITLIINSNCGRQKTFTFKELYPCSTGSVIIQHTPSSDSYFTFTASNTNLISPITTSWEYDTTAFNVIGDVNSQSLKIQPKSGVPSVTKIVATQVDGRGCTITKELNFSICKPTVKNVIGVVSCIKTNPDCLGAIGSTGVFYIPANACNGTSIDWTTLSIRPNNSFCVIKKGGNKVVIYARSGTSPGTYNFEYNVKNNLGVISDNATIQIFVPDCGNIVTPQSDPVIFNRDIELDDDTQDAQIFAVTGGDDIYIDVEDYIYSTKEIDWESFTFVAATGQTLNSPMDLTSTNADVIFSCNNRRIKYTLDTKNENVDLIMFKVADIDGQYSNTARWTVDWEAINTPTATNDSYTVSCGVPTILNILSNDTGDLIPESVEILTPPSSSASAVVNVDGTVTFTSTQNGAHSFTYRVLSTNQVWSNTATVNITSNCAGVGTTVEICPGSTSEDLTSFLTGSISSGGTWTQDPGNPGSVSLTDPTDVDFSAEVAGTYLYYYTVGSSVSTVTVIIPEHSLTITTYSQGVSNPFQAPTIPRTTVQFETIGVTNINNIEIEAEISSSVFAKYQADTWQGGIGQVTIALDQGVGTYTITISAVTNCGNIVTDSINITI